MSADRGAQPRPAAEPLRSLWDRQQINDALLRYCRGIDRCDRDLIASAYHEDGRDDHGVFTGTGPQFAEWAVRGLLSRHQSTTHVLTNVLIELDGATASCESLFFGSHLRLDSDPPLVQQFWGRYLDRFECRQDRWGIAARLAVYDWNEARRIGWAQQPDDPRFAHGARSRADPVYGPEWRRPQPNP